MMLESSKRYIYSRKMFNIMDEVIFIPMVLSASKSIHCVMIWCLFH